MTQGSAPKNATEVRSAGDFVMRYCITDPLNSIAGVSRGICDRQSASSQLVALYGLSANNYNGVNGTNT